ncbi:hypothetical protein MSAN_01108900 [Mycena sanguinolenta]|uniref:Uncharacterized protein n=1 Tax=Mycena sanguinolenta TaxID=230812 RepID=A0A8H6YV79_9AGAR|nr:hypothetical protein MSAN_01108900 [Mycena sanguinolenta]
MLSRFISVALFAFSLVHASPNPQPAEGDVARRAAPVAVKITSAQSLNPVVTFSGTPPLEVLVGQAAAPPGNFGIWERTELSADKYVFQNLGTGQWITINQANNHLVTVNGKANATVFAVESAGGGQFVIKLPNADSVWKALFDGTSPIFGRIIMSPADGTVGERWTFS